MLFKVYLRKINTDIHSKPFSEDWEMEITPQEGSYVLYDGDIHAKATSAGSLLLEGDIDGIL